MTSTRISLVLSLVVALLLGVSDGVYPEDYAAVGAKPAGTSVSQKFVLSAAYVGAIVLQTYELDHNKIKTTQSKTIAGDYVYGVADTAITFRTVNNTLKFDVYYSTYQDFDGKKTKLSLIRADSNLNSIIRKHMRATRVMYHLVAERLKRPAGVSLRLLTGNGTDILEQNLHEAGGLGVPLNLGIKAQVFSAAEDGRMIATSSGNDIHIRPFHPKGSINTIHIQDFVIGLALTGPVTVPSSTLSAGSIAVSNRYLFFVVSRFNGTDYENRVMTQKINNTTGQFIGVPKAFTEFKSEHVPSQQVAVTPGGNIVFYTEWSTSCNAFVLKAQVFNPQKGLKVGPPRTLLSCNGSNVNPYGISVTRFQ